MDKSELDNKFFIDDRVYNCPFCKRRNVRYTLSDTKEFDWSHDKKAYVYITKCLDCGNQGMHLSFDRLVDYLTDDEFNIDADLDEKFITHRPTSFFVLDTSIPRKICELVAESEECLQFNALTGASAALRKAIYTLLKKENCLVYDDNTRYARYDASLKSLKPKFPRVDEDTIDSLARIQAFTSDNVHEDTWEAWDSKTLRFLIELTKEILEEMYAEPARRKARKEKLNEISSAFGNAKNGNHGAPKEKGAA
jgi:hypothetical protein